MGDHDLGGGVAGEDAGVGGPVRGGGGEGGEGQPAVVREVGHAVAGEGVGELADEVVERRVVGFLYGEGAVAGAGTRDDGDGGPRGEE